MLSKEKKSKDLSRPSAGNNEVFSDLSSDAHALTESMFMHFYSKGVSVK